MMSISIHALREEGDLNAVSYLQAHDYFYPRPPRGGRRHHEHGRQHTNRFLSTPSARRATDLSSVTATTINISIHALREEGDTYFFFVPSRLLWISIHALREEGDFQVYAIKDELADFYPRPPRGGRQGLLHELPAESTISIHALREEGDCKHLERHLRASKFLSTPSARRATPKRRKQRRPKSISIHALREEGDTRLLHRSATPLHFYPRPPRGGRRADKMGLKQNAQISIHALREEGDYDYYWPVLANIGISIHALREEGDTGGKRDKDGFGDFYPRPPRGGRLQKLRRDSSKRIFLSTPSARRATAKTETKSLFSNKLYNILHEFRRALIYNGSKNYPNHAK